MKGRELFKMQNISIQEIGGIMHLMVMELQNIEMEE
jgi:hypothetical protein